MYGYYRERLHINHFLELRVNFIFYINKRVFAIFSEAGQVQFKAGLISGLYEQ